MRRYLVRRLGQSLAIVFLVVTVTFFLIHLAPGDPFVAALERPGVGVALREQMLRQYGFDRPLVEQYGRYLASLARGDLGPSIALNVPVATALRDALPNTLLLMGVSLVGSFLVGIALGVLQAVRRGTWADRGGSFASLLFYSMPDFWLALMLMLVFAEWLGVLPVSGVVSADYAYLPAAWDRFVDRVRHLVLPAGTLVLLTAAAVARYQRSAVLDVVHEDFVRTARAKGVGERGVVARHVLRNALLPVITLFGLAFPALLGGAVFVEYVFAWPGMGRLAISAIEQRDYFVVTASVIVGGVMVVIGNLLADALYALADPRLREG